MELPCRVSGDELLEPGELVALRERLRAISPRHDLATVIACAFDLRTRMLPFSYSDLWMVPAGVRAIGSAMVDVGFHKTRIVLQQWNRRFRPSAMQLDGRVPDIFMVSSMQIHTDSCKALLRDACRIEPSRRPLILAGGPKVIYEPWDVFSTDPADPWGADAAVTGEEYVTLSLLETLLSMRSRGEPLRQTFLRARDSGALDDIPGLVFAPGSTTGAAEQLVDTGIQRLLSDLDELPHPVLGYRLIEPPSRREGLASQALPADKVRKYGSTASLVMTFGCRFSCPYCPIPAYNQRQYRVKSPQRIADEIVRINAEYGIRNFFGTDDNFFNDKQRAMEIIQTLAKIRIDGDRIRKRIRWATEVTVHDTLRMKDHLRDAHRAGVWALWLGVEDMTGTLVKKGQSAGKTVEAFRAMQEAGICPMPMLMHHDGQPLYSRRGDYGLLNQARLLRKAGAVTLQVLMISPATGSRSYEDAFATGLMYESVAGRRVEQRMLDGNYVIASASRKPWRQQFNILLAYAYFYNPVRFLISLVHSKSRLYFADAYMQYNGMRGLLMTIRRTLGWTLRLWRGNIQRASKPPSSPVPMRSPRGGQASHCLTEPAEAAAK